MTAYITYQFDPQTGFIGATNSSDWSDDHPFLLTPNFVVATRPMPATITTTLYDGTSRTENTTVQAGWSFTLEKGVPLKDANDNYVVTPPPHPVEQPSVHTHIFAGLVKAGYIDLNDVAPDLLNAVNWSLASADAKPIAGTQLVALPLKEAATTANDMVARTLGVHSVIVKS